MKLFDPCIIVPVYNHGDEISVMISNIRVQADSIRIILVNDGSDARCTRIMRDLKEEDSSLELVEHSVNRGKGGAVKTGLALAERLGFSHGLQIDADGQHDWEDIPGFLEIARKHPEAVIAGVPQFGRDIPAIRYYARYLTHIWVWINTLSFQIKDSMCGYRVYPVARINSVITSCSIGDRMDFDCELLVRWVWENNQIVNYNTKIKYPNGGVSHFRVWLDNALIAKMHTKLFIMMLFKLPFIVWRRYRQL